MYAAQALDHHSSSPSAHTIPEFQSSEIHTDLQK